MKKFRKIKLGELANASLMSEAEMKMVTGGYGDGGYESGGYSSGSGSFSCVHGYSGGTRYTECWMSLRTAISFCQAYVSMGYDCSCHSC